MPLKDTAAEVSDSQRGTLCREPFTYPGPSVTVTTRPPLILIPYGNQPFINDFPIENGDFPIYSCLFTSLPDEIQFSFQGELQLERHRGCLTELQFIQQLPPESRDLSDLESIMQ